MVRETPPADWVVYLVVLGVVAAMMLGKFLMFQDPKSKEDETTQDTKKNEEQS